MFALSRYLASPCPPASTTADPSAFRSTAHRFVGSTPDLRLPKDPAALSRILQGDGGPIASAVLHAPSGRVPLADADGCRRAVLLSAVGEAASTALAAVTLTVRPGKSKHQQPELVDAALATAADRDAMIDLLAGIWADALPEARTAWPGSSAVWLGTDPRDPAGPLPGQVAAVGPAYGLDVEVVRDASRRAREIAVRLADRPPDYVVVWAPHAAGTERAVDAYEKATEEGEIIRLVEADPADALVELRLHFDELGLADPPTAGPASTGRTAPKAGEERFYVKGHGSAVGDMMIDVTDCGHGQWGSDCRRKAPRAAKGIAAGEGTAPAALFRCKKCTKHRWRARF